MSLFSNSVGVATTATPNFYVDEYEGANIGQYGWTKADQGRYNQLIQYVDECRKIYDQIVEFGSSLSDVSAQVAEVKIIYNKVLEQKRLIDEIYASFNSNFGDFTTKYADFNVNYEVFKVSMADFLLKYAEVIVAAREAKDAATGAKLSETTAAAILKEVQDIYQELKEGQVYRGVWDPTTNAYPDPQGTNSIWDVNFTGKDEHIFDGKTWKPGHRLLCLIGPPREFQQIDTGSGGVKSINGKTGAVTLTYSDVDAAQMVNDVIQVKGGAGGEIFGDTTATWITRGLRTGAHTAIGSSANAPVFFDGSNLREIYHTAKPPTYVEVGAVPTTRTVNGKELVRDVFLVYTDVGAVEATGRNSWFSSPAKDNVIGLLGWRHYGNGHVIFDASEGKSPDGTAIDKINSHDIWQSSFPTLMGWNGTSTYGVRVDSARLADSAYTADRITGTVSTTGQDINIHGKRAMVGDGSNNQLILNWGNDWGSTLVNGPVAFSGDIAVHNGSIFKQATPDKPAIRIDSVDTNNRQSKIWFHQPGVQSGYLTFNHDGWFAFDHNGAAGNASVLCHQVKVLNTNPGTDDTLTSRYYVNNHVHSTFDNHENLRFRHSRSDLNANDGGQGTYIVQPGTLNNPLSAFGHGIKIGAGLYGDGHWTGDIVDFHGHGLHYRSSVNGNFGAWYKLTFTGATNLSSNPTRFENSSNNNSNWIAAIFGQSSQSTNSVVIGSRYDQGIIGAHNHQLNSWTNFYVSCHPQSGDCGAAIIGRPHAKYPNNETYYKIYSEGDKPTTLDVQSINKETKEVKTLEDVISGLESEIGTLKLALATLAAKTGVTLEL